MRKLFQRLEHNNYLPKNASGHGFDGYFQTSEYSTLVSSRSLLFQESMPDISSRRTPKHMTANYLHLNVNHH